MRSWQCGHSNDRLVLDVGRCVDPWRCERCDCDISCDDNFHFAKMGSVSADPMIFNFYIVMNLWNKMILFSLWLVFAGTPQEFHAVGSVANCSSTLWFACCVVGFFWFGVPMYDTEWNSATRFEQISLCKMFTCCSFVYCCCLWNHLKCCICILAFDGQNPAPTDTYIRVLQSFHRPNWCRILDISILCHSWALVTPMSPEMFLKSVALEIQRFASRLGRLFLCIQCLIGDYKTQLDLEPKLHSKTTLRN